MSPFMSANDRCFTPEQDREFKKRRLNKQRAKAFFDLIGDVAQDVDQEEWEGVQTTVTASSTRADGAKEEDFDYLGATRKRPFPRGQKPSSSEQHSIVIRDEQQQPSPSHIRWAQIHNPSTSLAYDVQVVEDSGTGVNFIHPSLVEACDLQAYPTAPTVHQVITGHQFRSDRWVQVEWLGRAGRVGSDWFYVAPPEAPIELLVGRRFLKENRGVFSHEKPQCELVLLNVQSKKTESEKAQIQVDRAAADAQAAALERKRKEKLQQDNKLRTKSTSSHAKR